MNESYEWKACAALADGFDGNHASSDEVEPEVDLTPPLRHWVLTTHYDQVDGVRVAQELVVRNVVRLDAREVPDTHVTSSYLLYRHAQAYRHA